jgi:phenylpropionate dioxygenase-like ring-hydroxylating dioxygenase large terminal subunit
MPLEQRLLPPQAKPHASVARVAEAWYVVADARALGKKPLAITILGTPLTLFRTRSGRPGALLDRCPHRNVPLSAGRVEGEHLVCGYHGWHFDTEGQCQAVPGLVEFTASDRARRALAYPCVERDGWIWVWPSLDAAPDQEPFAFPALAGYSEARRVVEAPGTLHATIENALDVPHTAFLHGGLFRTAQKKNRVTAIVRRYPDRAVCEYVGEPRPTGLVGRLLSPSGGVVEHFDRFFLPSIAQVEYRIGAETHFIVTSACTPVSDFATRLFALVQFKTRLPGVLLKPLLEPIARRIFAQDRTMLGLQTETIQRFGGEQFESTDIDLLGPHIWRLLKDAERRKPGEPARDRAEIDYEKRVELMT